MCHLRPTRPRLAGTFALVLLLGLLGPSVGPLQAAPAPQRTRFELPSANGHGAILLDLKQRRLTQFREHLFAAEEPVLDGQGKEVWDGEQFATVHTRDLLFDMYFGVRAEGQQQWLTKAAVDEDASGYLAWDAGEQGGTGIVAMVQTIGALRATTYAFAPQALAAGGFVLLLKLENTGDQALKGVSAFSLHNFHLGYGRALRPWDVPKDIAANGETLVYDGAGNIGRFRERGFAGVVVTRALGPIAHRGVGPGADLFKLVDGGLPQDFPDNQAPVVAIDDSVSGFQWNLGDLAPGATQWAGVAVLHDPDPIPDTKAQLALDAFVAGKGAKALLDAEVAGWKALQAGVTLPAGVEADEAALLRQGAAMLHMGQVREDSYYLREWLSKDGEPRRTRFKGLDDQPVVLPAVVKHRGAGAILASLPPGEWTYAWIRDGAYATAAMAALGMGEHARLALEFYLDAEAGRFQSWDELGPYAMPPYQISLVRYHGFGVEETDFNSFGPNLEFDGLGLFLWALRAHEQLTGDTSVADARWPEIRDRVANVLVALIDPETGLMRADSSIWETHWNGRQRHFAYTSITAARGLCDAAAIAARVGDDERAAIYKAAGEALRTAIAAELGDRSGAIAANSEELALGEGYWDAAVLDAIAMGLFDPAGAIAGATLQGLDEHLRVDAGPGWSRNDDRWDHAKAEDLSPWGSDYDSAEWVITDLRGAIALRLAGQVDRADALTEWVRAQSQTNYGMVAETYDELTGAYKFNTPMLGFGAGAYALALAQRAGDFSDPACGAYYPEPAIGDTDTSGSSGDGSSGGAETSSSSSGGDPGATQTGDTPTDGVPTTNVQNEIGGPESDTVSTGGERGSDGGCACSSGPRGRSPSLAMVLVGLSVGLASRRRRIGQRPIKP
ncbi:glycoside hydrolase family 15 protein [Nannocystis sp.]|uniref:glycoside hydrolase family 15 protein n=1 Tax=Nannocystis sp. TaxID=1962667 RepID=UPI0025D95E50|nr:glycoside hydrolase family 15 protein [Nannocystis sp.]MBK7824334.1 glycosyl hydrolase [Nannocystis sp.]